MFERDKAILARPSFWLTLLRRAVNAWFYLLTLQVVVTLAIALSGVRFDYDGLVVLVLMFINRAWFALSVIAIPGWFAFRMGFVTCPYCGEKFARDRFLTWVVDPECQFCGYNPATLTRKGGL